MENKKAKTVRELIAELQQLDQDKHIWQVYDECYIWPAEVEVIDESSAQTYQLNETNIKEGDYMFRAS